METNDDYRKTDYDNERLSREDELQSLSGESGPMHKRRRRGRKSLRFKQEIGRNSDEFAARDKSVAKDVASLPENRNDAKVQKEFAKGSIDSVEYSEDAELHKKLAALPQHRTCYRCRFKVEDVLSASLIDVSLDPRSLEKKLLCRSCARTKYGRPDEAEPVELYFACTTVYFFSPSLIQKWLDENPSRTQRDIADILGRSRAWVSAFMNSFEEVKFWKGNFKFPRGFDCVVRLEYRCGNLRHARMSKGISAEKCALVTGFKKKRAYMTAETRGDLWSGEQMRMLNKLFAVSMNSEERAKFQREVLYLQHAQRLALESG